MAESYFEDYQDALSTLQEDGFAVTLIKKGSGGTDEYDNDGNPIPATQDVEFSGYGITTQFSAYYIANGIAKKGDCQLLFCPSEMTAEYIALYRSLEGGSGDQVYALVDGVEWRVNSGSQVKPTSTQVLAKLHLTK
jgi:hypothetical protein